MSHRSWLTLSVIWTVVILAATLVPASVVPSTGFGIDKIAHVALFAVFGFLWANAAAAGGQRAMVLILLAGLLFGAATEILQEVLPGSRSGDPMDGVADLVGVALGVLMSVFLPFSDVRRPPPDAGPNR